MLLSNVWADVHVRVKRPLPQLIKKLQHRTADFLTFFFFFCLNSGSEAWPPGVCLKYVGGDQFGHVNMVMVRSLEPQEIADVSVQMCSPSRAGMYQGQWRMCTATGLYYGGEYVLMQTRANELGSTWQASRCCLQN